VIDWTNARPAEPEFDLAYSALLPDRLPVDVPAKFRPLLARVGRRADRRFEKAYRKRRPLDEDKLVWYDALHALVRSHPSLGKLPANEARLSAFVSRGR